MLLLSRPGKKRLKPWIFTFILGFTDPSSSASLFCDKYRFVEEKSRQNSLSTFAHRMGRRMGVKFVVDIYCLFSFRRTDVIAFRLKALFFFSVMWSFQINQIFHVHLLWRRRITGYVDILQNEECWKYSSKGSVRKKYVSRIPHRN